MTEPGMKAKGGPSTSLDGVAWYTGGEMFHSVLGAVLLVLFFGTWLGILAWLLFR